MGRTVVKCRRMADLTAQQVAEALAIGATVHPCAQCKADCLVAPSTIALKGHIVMCNHCADLFPDPNKVVLVMVPGAEQEIAQLKLRERIRRRRN